MPTPSQVKDRVASRDARMDRQYSGGGGGGSGGGSQKGVPIRPNFSGMSFSGGQWRPSGGGGKTVGKK